MSTILEKLAEKVEEYASRGTGCECYYGSKVSFMAGVQALLSLLQTTGEANDFDLPAEEYADRHPINPHTVKTWNAVRSAYSDGMIYQHEKETAQHLASRAGDLAEVERLKARLLAGGNSAFERHAKVCDELTAEREKVRKLRKALTFYAHGEHIGPEHSFAGQMTQDFESGEVAREALKETE